VKRNGFSRHNKQRWQCLQCRTTYGWTNQENTRHRTGIWFERWVIEGYGLRQLSFQSGRSIRTMQRIISRSLERSPAEIQPTNTDHILFDGTFIYRRMVGVMVVMDGNRHELIAGAYGLKESYHDLARFFGDIRAQGCHPRSATVDGNTGAILALKSVWPTITIQRCLVHIQRQGLMWCRQQPKRTDAKKLRALFLVVANIHTTEERDHFLRQLASWEERYGGRIASSQETGWVFSDLKRARSMLIKALPHMFHYLNDPAIPWNTNGLEGYFSRLKSRYRQHRGLAQYHRKEYFNWYFYLCRR